MIHMDHAVLFWENSSSIHKNIADTIMNVGIITRLIPGSQFSGGSPAWNPVRPHGVGV